MLVGRHKVICFMSVDMHIDICLMSVDMHIDICFMSVGRHKVICFMLVDRHVFICIVSVDMNKVICFVCNCCEIIRAAALTTFNTTQKNESITFTQLNKCLEFELVPIFLYFRGMDLEYYSRHEISNIFNK